MLSRLPILLLAFLLATNLAHGGAWGTGSFENDDALDWVENFLLFDRAEAVREVLRDVGRGSGSLESHAACWAIAAAEVLAAAQGRPAPNLDPRVAALMQAASLRPDEILREDARNALDRILGDGSELRELWRETPDFERWKKSVRELRSRL